MRENLFVPLIGNACLLLVEILTMQLKNYIIVLVAYLLVGINAERAHNEIGDDLQDSVTNQGLGSDDLFFGIFVAFVLTVLLLVVFAPARN